MFFEIGFAGPMADYAGSYLNLRLPTSGSRGVQQKPIMLRLAVSPGPYTGVRDLHGPRDPVASTPYESG